MIEFEDDMKLDEQALQAMAEAAQHEGPIDNEEIFPPLEPAPLVAAPSVAARAVVGTSWTADQNTWLKLKYQQWCIDCKGDREQTATYWFLCAKEFQDIFQLKRTPRALRKQASLLKLTKGTQCLISKRRKRVKNWPLLIEQWIDDNVHPHEHLSNSYLLSVCNACYKHFQHKLKHTLEETLEETLKDTLEDILEDLRTRSIDAWHQKIARMRMHRKLLAPAP
jgi:hypothetical protein